MAGRQHQQVYDIKVKGTQDGHIVLGLDSGVIIQYFRNKKVWDYETEICVFCSFTGKEMLAIAVTLVVLRHNLLQPIVH